jgi:hypothetical protein
VSIDDEGADRREHELAAREHERAAQEHERAAEEHERAAQEYHDAVHGSEDEGHGTHSSPDTHESSDPTDPYESGPGASAPSEPYGAPDPYQDTGQFDAPDAAEGGDSSPGPGDPELDL